MPENIRRYQVILHGDDGYYRTNSYKDLDSAREGFERVVKRGTFMFVPIRQAWLVDRGGPEDALSLYPETLDHWNPYA